MGAFWRFAPWFNRTILLAVTIIFALISVKYITDPVHTAIASGIVAGSALAITTIRVGFGGFPLGSAIVILFCLSATRRLLMGLCFVTTVSGVILITRIFSVLVDHSSSGNVHLLVAEAILLTLSTIGIFIELGRRRYQLQQAA
ncbi:MAG TPA: hypothetical protein VFQ41_10680 [Candidatus Angelobacter sp.]|nr:hypothetical protein [Candidatus Angelobacter sp.]